MYQMTQPQAVIRKLKDNGYKVQLVQPKDLPWQREGEICYRLKVGGDKVHNYADEFGFWTEQELINKAILIKPVIQQAMF